MTTSKLIQTRLSTRLHPASFPNRNHNHLLLFFFAILSIPSLHSSIVSVAGATSTAVNETKGEATITTESKSLHLNKQNWDAATRHKTVFVQFYSKTCSHCISMAKAWEQLERKWENDQVGLIAKVDCDVERDFCRYHKVNGTPTIKFGDPNDLNDYGGDKDFPSLQRFAKKVLVPMCLPGNLDPCTEDQRNFIQRHMSMTLAQVEESVEKMEDVIKEAEKKFRLEMARMQERYDFLNDELVLLKARIQGDVNLMKEVKASRTIDG